MIVRVCAVVTLLSLAAAALAQSSIVLKPYLGLYQGSFESALTAGPDDDLNYNPCNPETGDCATHADPHIEILLALALDQDDELSAAFYRSTSQFRSAKTLDLLGRSCGTRVGGLENIERGDEGISWIARFDLSVENRSCLGKLRPTSSHFLLIRGLKQEDDTAPRVEVAIDKRIVNNNYLIVKEDGVERRVRLDLNNTQGTGRRARYRVCIEDDLGDFGRCVVTDKKLRQFAFPLPVPGGVAMNYTWWYDLVPNLKRTRDLYELEQYVARFERAQQ